MHTKELKYEMVQMFLSGRVDPKRPVTLIRKSDSVANDSQVDNSAAIDAIEK
ncbi:unnamed protein product [Haemonchus placei]|uniref:Transposase n=1 Tax=Haemonchus placei TaxID=6290 RepID=A0A0N4XBB4_HAEPC|nr:unnamed protein product [Haemonchus placei]